MDNPFADEDHSENNPFADPSVTAASNAADTPEIYNPFESGSSAYGAYEPPTDVASAPAAEPEKPKSKKKKKKKKKQQDEEEEDIWGDSGASGGASTALGRAAQAKNDAAVAGAVAGAAGQSIAAREAQLARREAELLQREKNLEEKIALARKQGMQPYNWPSSCYPVAYHNIAEEIPREYRAVVRKFYAFLLFSWLILIWNWLTYWARLFTSGAGGGITECFWASVYCIMGIPGAWNLWYRPLYFAIRDEATTKWITFFIHFAAHMGFFVVMAIGIPKTAGAGMVLMIEMFSDSKTLVGIFALAGFGAYCLNVLIAVYLMKRAHSVWKSSGAEDKADRQGKAALMAAEAAGAASDTV